MSINPSVAVPFGSKYLGNLSKNTPMVNELLTAILKAVKTVGAHEFTGRKYCVSMLLSFLHVSMNANDGSVVQGSI
jgi:hypothetical protein